MTIWEALFQGIVQGLTEFLPVSSSGHLSLFQYFTGNSGESGLVFSIVLHLGTLIAVLIAFRKTIGELIVAFFAMLRDIFTGRFSFKKLTPMRRMLLLLLLALVPLFILLPFKDFFESFSTDNSIVAEGVFFLFTAFLILYSDRCAGGGKTAKDMAVTDSLLVGAAQGVAMLPGLSRSGSTISAGLIAGLKREYAVSFSFILGIPAVFGAAILEIPEAFRSGISFSLDILLVGLVTSAVFGFLAIKLVNLVVKTNKFKYFGYYTLFLGIAVIAVGFYEILSDHALQRMFTGVV